MNHKIKIHFQSDRINGKKFECPRKSSYYIFISIAIPVHIKLLMHNHASIAYCCSTDRANIIIIIIIIILICDITKSELRAEMQEQKKCKIECQLKPLH